MRVLQNNYFDKVYGIKELNKLEILLFDYLFFIINLWQYLSNQKHYLFGIALFLQYLTLASSSNYNQEFIQIQVLLHTLNIWY